MNADGNPRRTRSPTKNTKEAGRQRSARVACQRVAAPTLSHRPSVPFFPFVPLRVLRGFPSHLSAFIRVHRRFHSSRAGPRKEISRMVEHVVLFKLKPETTAEQRAAMCNALGELGAQVPGILDISCGTNF